MATVVLYPLLPSQPEALIIITGTGFDRVTVRANVTMLPQLTVHYQDSTQIQVYLPTVRALQTSPYYQPNTIQLNCDLIITNHDGSVAIIGLTNSSVVPIAVLCGPPTLGTPAPPGPDGNLVFGTPREAPPGVSGEDCEALGGPSQGDGIGGELRFYPGPLPPPSALPLTPGLPATDGSGRVVLADPPATLLHELRIAGTPVTTSAWHDDGLIVPQPPPGAGFFIAWREDIPSAPVASPVLSTRTCASIQAAIQALLSANLLSPPPLPVLDPGQSFPLLAEAFANINAILDGIAQFTQSPVRWSWNVTGSGVSSGQDYNLTTMSETVADLLLRPDMFAQESNAPANRQFIVQLVLTVDVPGCGTMTFNVGPPITLQQAPLPVPTIAILFQNTDFTGNMLIHVPGNTQLGPLESQFVHRVIDGINQVQNALTPLRTLLSLSGVFNDHANPISNALTSPSFAQFVRADSIDDLHDVVFRGWNFTLDFLNFDGARADHVFNSLILIGAPGTKYHCFNHGQEDSTNGEVTFTTELELIVIVQDLGQPAPGPGAVQMSVTTIPDGSAFVNARPAGQRPVLFSIVSFGGSFMSLQFSPAP